MKKGLSVVLCLTLCVALIFGSIGVAFADPGEKVNSYKDVLADEIANNPQIATEIDALLDVYPYMMFFYYSISGGYWYFSFSDSPMHYSGDPTRSGYSYYLHVISGSTVVEYKLQITNLSFSSVTSVVASGSSGYYYGGDFYVPLSSFSLFRSDYLRKYTCYFNYDIVWLEKRVVSLEKNIVSAKEEAESIGLTHFLSGSSYCIKWNKDALSDYEILRSVIYIDVMFDGVSYEQSIAVNSLADGFDISSGTLRIPLKTIKQKLVEQLALTLGQPEDVPDVSELEDISVTSFTVKFSDADGTLSEKSYTYNDKVLNLMTGALVDSSKLDENYNETPSQIPDYDPPVDSFDEHYANTVWRHFVGTNSQISEDFAMELYGECTAQGLPVLFAGRDDGKDALYTFASDAISNALKKDIPSLFSTLVSLCLSGEFETPIDYSAYYRYAVVIYTVADASTNSCKFYFFYTPLYFQTYLVNLVRLEDINANISTLVSEVHYLYKIEYLQYDALYTMYKMQEAELLRQTDYLRSVDAALSDLNSRYVPFDDTEVLQAIRAVSFDFDGQTIEDAIVNALSKITVNVRLPDDSDEDDGGGILDALLPDWLVELKNFVQMMITGDGSTFDYLVRLFTFYTDFDSVFYIDTDEDGTIFDEWRSEETWSP